MSSGERRTVSNRDIQVVQNLIEQCIQLHMSRTEVVNTLLLQAKIEPGFTELVWQKLEEENREFFEAYNIRLALKHHIVMFNELLKKQVELMNQFQSAGISSLEAPNGSQMSQYNQNSGCFDEGTGESIKQESLHPAMVPSLHHQFTNGISSFHGSVRTASDLSALSGGMDTLANTLSAQSSDLRIMQGMNGSGMIKPESCYAPDSCFMFDSESNVLETRAATGETPIGSYNNLDSGGQVTGLDDLSFGFDMARNFSLSDLTAGYSRTDIMESYSRSPFLGSTSESFLDSRGQGLQGPDELLLSSVHSILGLDSHPILAWPYILY